MPQIPVFPDSYPQFDELYSVSDLHMGGETPGAQIFASGDELAALIQYVRDQPAERVVFVINGDAVDFLAEPDAKAFDPDGAETKLNRIIDNPSFKEAWTALSEFIRKDNRYLAITLGNHDLELALPWVRARLLNRLAGDDAAARGRIFLAFDGAGFRCRVGSAEVLCVHGNEVDDWNVTDYEAIRRMARDLQQGQLNQSATPWIPNAGTHLVIDAMNDIKRGYPFVDLLKPEKEAVLPALLAVAPEKADRIRAALPVLWQLTRDKIRRAIGFLGGAEEEKPAPTGAPRGPRLTRGSAQATRDLLLARTEGRFRDGVKPLDLVPSDSYGAYLGGPGAILKFITGADRSEVLREALDQLWKDRSFEPAQSDDTFERLDEAIGANFDFILAGHTHLRRSLKRRKARGWYFNSGTWARLIKLEARTLADADEFAKVFAALKAGTMQALDDYPDLVMRQHTVVAIRPDGDKISGQLLQWDKPGTLQKIG
jgi:UDP-2,3-diacylglucosamine pyrophosphatase LpxH